MDSYFVRFCFAYSFVFSNIGIISKIVYNTHEEIITRSTIFIPEVVNKICLLQPDVGPCRAEIPMYFFEPRYQNCSMFLWGGCQGNGNRFDSNSDCRQTCLSKPGQKRKPKWCSLTFDYGFCFGSVDRWYYDPLWKVCKKRIYSGCGGNKNNFYNKEQCDAICNFGTGPIRSRTRSRDGLKKILIVNPLNMTRKRGRYQETTKGTTIKGIKDSSTIGFTNDTKVYRWPNGTIYGYSNKTSYRYTVKK